MHSVTVAGQEVGSTTQAVTGAGQYVGSSTHAVTGAGQKVGSTGHSVSTTGHPVTEAGAIVGSGIEVVVTGAGASGGKIKANTKQIAKVESSFFIQYLLYFKRVYKFRKGTPLRSNYYNHLLPLIIFTFKKI